MESPFSFELYNDFLLTIYTRLTQSKLEDIEDSTALQFLRARKGNVPAAVKQYLECAAWRKNNNLDDGTFLNPDENEAIYRSLCPHRNHKYDKQGHPVCSTYPHTFTLFS